MKMLIVCTILFPVIAGIAASVTHARSYRSRCMRYALISVASCVLGVLTILYGERITLLTFAENVTLTFALDAVGRFFLAAVLILYTCAAFYSMEYMKMEEDIPQFFGFFYVSLGALIAVCAADNLATVYLAFEMATLTTVPLVLHERTKAAVSAGLKYLFYSIGGALMGLFGVFFVYYYGMAGKSFVLGGFLDKAAAAGHEKVLLAAVMVAIIGFGTKAGMYPMHGWLPTAHPIAPAPASALLSGIIAKAGVIAVIRLVYYCVGADFIRGTYVQYAWMILAMLTIFMGSMMAFLQKNMKKRLAYSTVSQISYIMLALSLLSEGGVKGALLHVMSHAASKGCLFLCAGVFIYKLGKRGVDELAGVGRQMPVVMWCFLIASLSLVGIPPMGGFLSKWVIALNVADDGMKILSVLPVVVLLISAMLTAGYLFPVAFRAFFPGKDAVVSVEKEEPNALMTVPMMVLCGVALVMGIWGLQILEMFGF
ncbi:MAG TPA: proton-conducting membrane transporter [Lachnospiraceae bacterium]|nr:proton-conducting membrane transporter [Lachnospiraceae bacterium]